MSKISVPAAPHLEVALQKTENARPAAPEVSPLDAAFLSRIYRSMLWFGAFLVLLSAPILGSVMGVWSFAAGIGLAALMLKAQEFFVRAVLQPKNPTGLDARLVAALLMPLKMALIAVVLGFLFFKGWVWLGPLGAGFFGGNLVVLAKIAGRWRPRDLG